MYLDEWSRLAFVKDATGGVRVETEQEPPETDSGEVVELTGIATAGGQTPLVSRATLHSLGRQAICEAKPIQPSELLSPDLQYRLVEVSGVVRSADLEGNGRLGLVLNGQGREVRARIYDHAGIDPVSLVDSVVHLRGVLSMSIDATGVPHDARLWTHKTRDIRIDAKPREPASIPLVTVAIARSWSSGELPAHRVRLRGLVRGSVFRDGTGELPLLAEFGLTDIPAGEQDVLGFVEHRQGALQLSDPLIVRAVASGTAARDALRMITSVKEIKSLSPEQAALGYPVRLRAIVTFHDPSWKFLTVHDGTGGIYVAGHTLSDERLPTGEIVFLEGKTGPGEFAPIIASPHIVREGTGSLPRAARLEIDELLSGREDSNWIEAHGVVQSVLQTSRDATLELNWGAHRFWVRVLGAASADLRLQDAEIRLRGVASTLFNSKRQFVGIRIMTPSYAFIEVVNQPSNPFEFAPLRIADILRYSPSTGFSGRQRMQGVVMLSRREGPTYIRDGASALTIQHHLPLDLTVGDIVDVAGIPRAGEFSPSIEEGEIRKIRSSPPPSGVPMAAGQVLDDGLDLQLVTIDGVLLGEVNTWAEKSLVIQSERVLFTAKLNSEQPLPVIAPGSVLRLTGVSTIARDGRELRQPRARGFSLLLRSPGDVMVLRKAPWFTFERTMEVLGILSGVAVLALLWVFALRRRVSLQTGIIRLKLAQEEALKDAAEQANRTKSEFLACMSHEIRTPMNGVLGVTELLRDTNLTRQQREYTEMVRTSAQGLLGVINDILDFSKVEAGKMELEIVPFRPADHARNALQALDPLARGKGLRASCKIAGDVPPAISGDPNRLNQVLTNLVGNAIKFTPRGEVELSLVTEEQPGPDGACILHYAVRDTGIGIPREKQRLIFEAFSQADASTTRRFGGTGLGLAISFRLVALMGGRIWVESEPGCGSTFHFTVRAWVAAEEDAPRCGAEEQEPGTVDNSGALRILLAEDNPINQRVAVELLNKRGHSTVVADDGLRALEAFINQSFDVVLMDVQMPAMDGYQATEAIRRHEAGTSRRTPIIAMTAHAMSGDAERCRAAGMDGYLPKPIRPSDLYNALARLAMFASKQE
jgi:signal transduction histidine kinase/ActR/RegA family two-component response regulator